MDKLIAIVGSADTGLDKRQFPSLSPRIFDFLEDAGYRLTPSSNGNFLISFNHNMKKYKEFIAAGGAKQNTVLIRTEPDAVFPAQYDLRVESLYGLIISPGSVRDFKRGNFFTGWPYTYHSNPAKPSILDQALGDILQDQKRQKYFNVSEWEKRSIPILLIAANKVSPTLSANYKLRRKIVSSFPLGLLHAYGPLWNDKLRTKLGYRFWLGVFTIKSRRFPNLFSLYGNLLKTYPSAKGTIDNKHLLLQDAKFSLVIENSNSFTSEKIFDAILNGAIPIYVGPKLKDVGLPGSIAVESSGNISEVYEIITKMDSKRAQELLTSMSKFIDSQLFKETWTADFVWKCISDKICEHFMEIT